MKTQSRHGSWVRAGGLILTPLALAILASTGAMAAPGTLNYKQIPQFVNILPNPLDPGPNTFIWQPDTGA